MLRIFCFVCLSVARPIEADTEVSDLSCGVDVSFLQTDINFMHERARPPDRHLEPHDPNVDLLTPAVEHRRLETTPHHASLDDLQRVTGASKRQVKQVLDVRPVAFFQTDAVVHHSHEETVAHIRSGVVGVIAQLKSDWVLQMSLIGTVLCSLWLWRSRYKRWLMQVVPAEEGDKGIQAAEVAKASTTPSNAKALFSTPVRDAFGLSVDRLQAEEANEPQFIAVDSCSDSD